MAGKRAWLIAGAVAALLVLELGWIATAPDVADTCTHVLALAEQAGETVDAGDREACEQRYATLRERLGLRAWAKLARCVARARTIPDAGGC
jgi:hypothetical protein